MRLTFAAVCFVAGLLVGAELVVADQVPRRRMVWTTSYDNERQIQLWETGRPRHPWLVRTQGATKADRLTWHAVPLTAQDACELRNSLPDCVSSEYTPSSPTSSSAPAWRALEPCFADLACIPSEPKRDADEYGVTSLNP